MQAGERIGPYVVESHLGSGQMGIVYAVRRPDLDARYAVKVLRRELCAARDLMRFQREIELLAAVSKHPHVVPIHSAGEDRCGLYYVMDLVEGPTLQDLLARGGAMPPSRAARYVRDIADALTALHRAGIVHRDIKPSNVLVDARDAVRLADFGLARTFADDKGRLTNTGELVGTPHFMSPEQALGFPVGPPADVYALGMVLFTLLAGRPAVEGKGLLEVLTRVGSGELVPLPKLAPDTPDALFKVIARCLKHEAAARPPAAEVVEALESFLRTATPQRVAPRRSRAVVGLSVVAGASMLGGALALVAARRARPVEAAAPVATAVAPVSTRVAPPPTSTKPALPLARLERASVEGLREVLASVDALGPGDLSEEQRRTLRASLLRLDGVWADPLRGDVFLDATRVDEVADAVERLVLTHTLLQRLDPAHRLPPERRECVAAAVFAQLGRHVARLGPTFVAKLVALVPEDLNLYVLYCDATAETWRLESVVDLDILRRGIVFARAEEEHLAWGRMLRTLATYLWMKSGTNQAAEAIAELRALVAEAETARWVNADMITAMCYLNLALNHAGQFDEALEVTQRARRRSPTQPDPVGRGVVTQIIRAAVRPPADDAWLEQVQADAEEYFRLMSRVAEKDENVTHAVVVALCEVLEARGQAAAAEALCARALKVHDVQPMPAIACRRVLLLCRLEATAPLLVQALEDAAARMNVAAALHASLRGADPTSPEHRARTAAIDVALELIARVRDGNIPHGEVATRLATACGAARIVVALRQPLRR